MPRPYTLAGLLDAYQTGQRDAEQGWRLGPERWDIVGKEASAAYWLGFAAPRVTADKAPRIASTSTLTR